ncbi:MAG: cell wall hydrolase [Alistipes sp.]|nr:cell wall hydrolase [Alistipes sp.]
MRKAKFAALIIGGVSTCIFGGLFGVCATAPVVSSVAPSNDVKNIYEVNSEEMSNVAAVTSIRTTAITTTSKITTTTMASTTTAVGAVTTTTENNTFYMDASLSLSGVQVSIAAAPESTTEAPTESYTEAPVYDYGYSEPVYDKPAYEEPVYNEPVYDEPVYEEPSWDYPETPAEEATEPQPEQVEVSGSDTGSQNALPITDEEYIILCNAVAHEAGCNWINEYDKAKVVEVIMNRVYSSLYPNTILEVLTQPYQFSGSSAYVYLGDFSGYVTQSVKDAVSLYFNEPGSFTEGYLGFYGDGYRNYFY